MSGEKSEADQSVDDLVDKMFGLNTKGKKVEEKIEDDDSIDEVFLKDIDSVASKEDLEKRKQLASENKDSGNELFKNKEYEEARKKYTEALRTCPLEYKSERAIFYANRAAAKAKLDLKSEAIEDCSKALELNPTYMKALLRRAKLLEDQDSLSEALSDYKKILEIDPGNSEARIATMRLPSLIDEKNEKAKAQMLGSLKEIGNKILGNFGLSTDNFQVQQDPNSGKYSINFKSIKK